MKCELCGRELKSETGLQQHYRDKHPAEKLPGPAVSEEPARKREGRRRGLRRRTSKRKRILITAVIVILALSGAATYVLYNTYAHPSGPYGSLPFPCAGSTLAEHVHPWLSIVISGQNISIPAHIGIVNGGSCLEPVHTHDTSGIIHVEPSSTSTEFTLNDFFQIWKATSGTATINGAQHPIVFNSTDILGFKADRNHKVLLLVDGQPSSEWGALNLSHLDYCSSRTTGPPCSPTGVGDPYWNGAQYPYGVGHTIVIEYTTATS